MIKMVQVQKLAQQFQFGAPFLGSNQVMNIQKGTRFYG